MFHALAPEIPPPGFSFENCRRNANLEKWAFLFPKLPRLVQLLLVLFTRTELFLVEIHVLPKIPLLQIKNCMKIHYLASNMYCCGAGTAADTEKTTAMVASNLELHRLNTNRIVPVPTANQMLKQFLFRYQGHIGAALILGGVDNTGSHLYCIYPHGSSDKLPYTTMGSGSLAAMSVFESRWKPDLSEEEGKKLVRDAIASGIFNDLGSGSNVDLCIIRKGSVEYLRTYDEANKKGTKQGSYRYPKGTTVVLSTKSKDIVVDEVSVRRIEAMDTSS